MKRPLAPLAGRGSGVRGKQLTQYFLQHDISLLQHVIIPEADYPKAFRFKIRCSLGIGSGPFEMLPPIQFHYQLLFNADEVNDKGRNRMLSPELEPTEMAVFQLQPESQFRVG